MDRPDTHFVEIVRYENEEVIERRGPFSERRADKIDDGLNINLNHEEFFTRIVNDASLRPRPGETPEQTVERVTNAVRQQQD